MFWGCVRLRKSKIAALKDCRLLCGHRQAMLWPEIPDLVLLYMDIGGLPIRFAGE